jgi:hypothetical protein
MGPAGWGDLRTIEKNHCCTKAGKETPFCRTHRNQKMAFSSFYLLLHEVEYKMAWRLVGRMLAGEGIAVGDLGVWTTLSKAGGQSFCGTI